MTDERVMERNVQPLPAPPCDVHFQLSLLRPMYLGSSASPQVAALEQLRETAGAALAQG